MLLLMLLSHCYPRGWSAIGWLAGYLACGTALGAEKAVAPTPASRPLDFSSGIRSEGLLPEADPEAVGRTRLEFLNRRSSVGGVLDGMGGIAPPTTRTAARELRSGGRTQGRLDFEEIWRSDRPTGTGPSASEFERAAGVRNTDPALWLDNPDEGIGAFGEPTAPLPQRPIDQSSIDLGSGRLEFSQGYDFRGSLDPVLDFGLPQFGPNRTGLDAPPAGDVLPRVAEAESRVSLWPEVAGPLGLNPLEDLASRPRTVRDLLDGAHAGRGLEGSQLQFDRDTTRDALNPYTPRWREDLQFSVGVSSPAAGAAGSLSPYVGQPASRSGASSLSPALALPVPDPLAGRSRRAPEAQFPSRPF